MPKAFDTKYCELKPERDRLTAHLKWMARLIDIAIDASEDLKIRAAPFETGPIRRSAIYRTNVVSIIREISDKSIWALLGAANIETTLRNSEKKRKGNQ